MKRICLLLVFAFILQGPAYAKEGVMSESHLEKATFAGGCFWCMQPFFDRLKGVKQVLVGYTGGHQDHPNYEEVSSGMTGHAEAIEITFDPAQVDYDQLLNIFWHNIDPTAVDSQFVDHGTQYRSEIFYHGEEQKRKALLSKKKLEESGKFKKPIVTRISEAKAFFPAENYHQSYYKTHPIQYKMYHDGSGREDFLKRVWGSERDQGGH